MKRNITLFLLQILFIVKATAQPEIRGIALCDLSSFRKGDTISIKGYIYDKTKGIEKYLVKSDNVERYVSASYIQLLDNDNESNLLALEYIEAAQQIDHYHLAEVLLVKGIILMRLERLDEAREVLNEFISASENFYFRVLPRSFFFLALHYRNLSSGNVNELAEDIAYNKKYNTYCRIIFLP